MMSWLFLPPWGFSAVAAAGATLVLVTLIRALREHRTVPVRRQIAPILLRGLVVAGLLLVALNPTAILPREMPGRPALTVLVDASRSMSTEDAGGRSRLAAAAQTLIDDKALERLERQFAVDLRTFDESARPATPDDLARGGAATGQATHLAQALTAAVLDAADRPAQAGVLLVSDGRATDAGAVEAARLALARGVPLWTWCLGGEVDRHDLWIDVPAAEQLAFAGAELELTATLHAVGYENRRFRIALVRDGQEIDAATVQPAADGTAKVSFPVTAPDQGEHRYAFRVDADAAEAETQNNERAVFLRIVGQKARVLVVEGQPHWDTKFLVQSLKRNEHVEVTVVYRLADDRQFAVVSAGDDQRRDRSDLFPRTADQFAEFDVVIMGRGCEAFFDADTPGLLQRFVARDGGGLVFSRGRPYGSRFEALSRLEPVVWDRGTVAGVRLSPTTVGYDNPVLQDATAGALDRMIAELPAFDEVAQTVGVKPLAVVLANAETARADAPEAISGPGTEAVAVAYHHYGQGRVVTLNASGLWRWAFREKTLDEAEVVYDRFWDAMLRWLVAASDFSAGNNVSLRTDRRLYADDEPIELLVRTRGIDLEAYSPRLTIRGTEGVVTELEPRDEGGGAFTASAGPFAPGSYEVVLESNLGRPQQIAMTLDVVGASTENRILSADPDLMRALAETSDGQVVDASDVGRLGEVVARWQAAREQEERRETLWDRWALLGVVLAVLGTEWFLRRREGLL